MRLAGKILTALPLLAVACFGADVRGIWMGVVEGRNGEKQDMAFQFRQTAGGVTGVLFGDEFDLPVEGFTATGDRVSFFVTVTDYRDKKKTKQAFEGSLSGIDELTLTRDRPGNAADAGPPAKQSITLKRIAKD